MADFLTELAAKSGLEGDLAHRGVGAVLEMLKGRLDPQTFSHLTNAIPNAGNILSSLEDKMPPSGGGVMDAVKGMVGKLLGGTEQDAPAALEKHFENAGLSPEHVKSLLPHLHDMLAQKLPPDVLKKIEEHVAGFEEAPA
jgi:hypothetical protein